MLVLGIETTCDETAIAIVENGVSIRSNVVHSQANLHASFGGVFPEVASRSHVDAIATTLEEALDEAEVALSDINLIAVAEGPGLIGPLMVGIHFAKGLCLGLDIPIVGVNHIEAHLYSVFMSHENKIPLPALGVVLSGGHTALIEVKAISNYVMLGQTQDDACGEAFDKVAQLLELPYPGGPHIEELAKTGNPSRFPFKAGSVKNHPLDFSFSGLKTAVLYLLKGQNSSKNIPQKIVESDKKDIAASFQHSAFSDIVNKAVKAAALCNAKSVIIGGGVSQNQTLRSYFSSAFTNIPLFWPQQGLSLDNGAMIAGLGYNLFQTKGAADPATLVPKPRILL